MICFLLPWPLREPGVFPKHSNSFKSFFFGFPVWTRGGCHCYRRFQACTEICWILSHQDFNPPTMKSNRKEKGGSIRHSHQTESAPNWNLHTTSSPQPSVEILGTQPLLWKPLCLDITSLALVWLIFILAVYECVWCKEWTQSIDRQLGWLWVNVSYLSTSPKHAQPLYTPIPGGELYRSHLSTLLQGKNVHIPYISSFSFQRTSGHTSGAPSSNKLHGRKTLLFF